jgi:hypothetical protein
MSEYQYYEFQALDRPLTREQMAKLRAVSSRARISPYSFVNEYNWGSFKGDPNKWMDEYFDAFVYFADWGSRWFMVRLPAKVLDLDTVEYYCAGENFSCRQKNDHIVLSFDAELEGYELEENEGSWLASLIPLRTDLMRGDLRALYLGWLLAEQFREVDEDELEPPVLPGLGYLNGSLECLADFLGIDFDLVAAAAESSEDEQLPMPSKNQIDEWVRNLPIAAKDAIVTRLIDGDDLHLAAEVRRRAILEMNGSGQTVERPRRTAGELLARAEALASERKKKEAATRAREKSERERKEAEARKTRLESLAGKENNLWSNVDKLVSTKQPRRYDEAVSIVRDLHDLAQLKGKFSEFESRMSALRQTHSAKGTLIERFRKAGLLEYERGEVR